MTSASVRECHPTKRIDSWNGCCPRRNIRHMALLFILLSLFALIGFGTGSSSTGVGRHAKLVGDRKREYHRKGILNRHPALRPDNEWRDARELRGRDVEGRPAGAPPSVPQGACQAVTATGATP